jgi:single-stranded DNA-binding protein
MNHLNSVLIEGECVEGPKDVDTGTGFRCDFRIKSVRIDSSQTNETTFVDVEASGRLGLVVEAALKPGRSVRVVGRLREVRQQGVDGTVQSSLKIVAEHVEFQPGRA